MRPATKNAVFVLLQTVNSLSFNGHRVMIEAGAGETQLFGQKYSEAGAEITNDTAKVFSCPMILKWDLPLLKSQ
jgi:alanine dehydrogenase